MIDFIGKFIMKLIAIAIGIAILLSLLPTIWQSLIGMFSFKSDDEITKIEKRVATINKGYDTYTILELKEAEIELEGLKVKCENLQDGIKKAQVENQEVHKSHKEKKDYDSEDNYKKNSNSDFEDKYRKNSQTLGDQSRRLEKCIESIDLLLNRIKQKRERLDCKNEKEQKEKANVTIMVQLNAITQQLISVEENVKIGIKQNSVQTITNQNTVLYNIINQLNSIRQTTENNIYIDKTTINKEITKIEKRITQIQTTINNYNITINKINTGDKKSEEEPCYYAIGSEEKLLEENLISKNFFGMISVNTDNTNSELFIPGIPSVLRSIPLYAKKAKVLSDMPSDSYKYVEVNGMKVLVISNPENFWKKTKYLIVRTAD